MGRPIYTSINEALEDVAAAYRKEPARELSQVYVPERINEGESLDSVRRRIIDRTLAEQG